jgi:hypothetical protein
MEIAGAAQVWRRRLVLSIYVSWLIEARAKQLS